jgi:cyclopropane fatty-acyl-phospholipid synthase-like methyltransferase
MPQLVVEQAADLDPYAFPDGTGQARHTPGGRASTDRLLEWAAVQAGEHVLDIGCGVGTSAVRLARQAGAHLMAADISPLMRERAAANVAAPACMAGSVRVDEADILELPYPDGAF